MKKNLKAFFKIFLALVLTVAAINAFGCAKPQGDDSTKTITVTVIDDKGESTEFVITTTSPNLRGALEQENLIEGEESQYGLYVKVVNGVRADYDTDGAYWSFTKEGTILMTGVDDTVIADGDKYEITYTKA